MSNNTLLIPDKLKVGFDERSDTYTGKLAYVIYYDQTGKLRKEKSWESWRDKTIDPQEVKNEPVEGFVLNRNVGGVSRYSHSWDQRMEKCRVYDPRGWEFEITIPNLLFILQECTSVKGKGLDGQFVYGWSGTELVLLPITSSEYKESQKFTQLQAKKIGAKDLIVGATYHTKQQEDWVYLGKFDWYESGGQYINKITGKPTERQYREPHYHTSWRETKRKKYVFVSLGEYQKVEHRGDLTNLAAVVDENVHMDYATLFEKFSKSANASYFTGLVATSLTAENFLEAEQKEASRTYKYYYGDEDEFSAGFNSLNPVIADLDGSYTMYKCKMYKTLNPNYDRTVKDSFEYVHSGAYMLSPEQKIWFENGRKCRENIEHTHIHFDGYFYNPQTGRSEHRKKPDNRNNKEQIIVQKNDNFFNVGFQKLEIEFESKIKHSVKDY